MRKLYLGMAMAALVALPTLASAQQEAPRAERREEMRAEMGAMMFANPAEILLRHQAELRLSPDQLEKLGQIRDHFAHENAEDLAKAQKEWDEIVAKYGQPPYSEETRNAMSHDREEAHKKYSKLFDNEEKARGEAWEVLTPEQRETVSAQLRWHGPGEQH